MPGRVPGRAGRAHGRASGLTGRIVRPMDVSDTSKGRRIGHQRPDREYFIGSDGGRLLQRLVDGGSSFGFSSGVEVDMRIRRRIAMKDEGNEGNTVVKRWWRVNTESQW